MANRFTPKNETIGGMLQEWDGLSPIPELMNWDLDTDCYEWTRHRSPSGYALVKIDGKPQRVSRYLLGLLDREDYIHIQAMHLCDNPPCVNLRHLRIGTRSENNKRPFSIGRQNNKGSNHSQAKLTEGQVLGIKILLSLGQDNKSIALAYGVNQQTIHSIKRGIRWGHVILSANQED